MPTKMFKNMGLCPHTKVQIDSPTCRQCKYYYRPGTNPFIWCCHPVPEKVEPLKPKTVFGKPVGAKSNGQQEKPQKETGKRPGRPKKNPTTTGKRKNEPTGARKAKG